MKDMSKHGTHDGLRRKGERHPLSILTEEQVKEIRESSEKGTVLAERYGIAQSTVSSIRHHGRWKHV